MSELSLTDLHREVIRLGHIAAAASVDASVPRDVVRAHIHAWGDVNEARAVRMDEISARIANTEEAR